MSNDQYDVSSIKVITPTEAIRRRPGMYIGAVDDAGNHLLRIAIASAVDGHELGDVDRVRVGLDGAVATVEDNGPGIPLPLLERLSTCIHAAGAHWRRERHRLFHLGVPVVNGLSARFELVSWHDGRAHAIRFTRGLPDGPPVDLGPTTRHGTSVTFAPDPSVIEVRAWDRDRIVEYLSELAAFNPELTVVLDRTVCRCPDGLSDLVRMRAGDPWSVPIRCVEDHGDAVHVDAALLWTDQPRVDVRGYVNQTRLAGVHLDALRWAVVAAMRQLDERLFRVHPPALFEVAAEGLVAAVHVELADPKRTQCGDLTNHEAATAVLDTVTAELSDALADDHALRDRLLSRIPR